MEDPPLPVYRPLCSCRGLHYLHVGLNFRSSSRTCANRQWPLGSWGTHHWVQSPGIVFLVPPKRDLWCTPFWYSVSMDPRKDIRLRPPQTFKHIARIDHVPSRPHSWFVSVQRRGQIYRKHFSDSRHSGKRQALEAAKQYRDHLLASLRPLTRQEYCAIRKMNNRSGISGGTRIDVMERSRGRIYPPSLLACAMADWGRQG